MPPVARFRQDPEFAALVDDQESVLSRRQLRERGVTRHLVSNRVRAGTWQLIGPNVVAMQAGQLTRMP